jgi:starvation-inducible DNA-binding protein
MVREVLRNRGLGMITDLVRGESIAKPSGRRARLAKRGQGSRDAQIQNAVSAILLDVSSLYFKTGRSLRHIVGPNVRNYRLLLEEQRAQLSGIIDQISERNRKMGVTLHKSVYQLIQEQGAPDQDAAYVQPLDILDDLYEDNRRLLAQLQEACAFCNRCMDIATASWIEVWIDETTRRNWAFSLAVE